MDSVRKNFLIEAVFKIHTSSSSGSGFYLKDKNIIVTNQHVVEGNRTVSIEDQKKNRYIAKVIFVNPQTDIAFLSPEKTIDIQQLEIGNHIEVKNQDQVFVLGFPFGMPFTITEGIVSSPKQLVEGRHYIQTDAAVNPGNSGGPIVNHEGKVIGITTSKFTEADNVGFAIPVDVLNEEFESVKENKNLVFSVKCNSCKTLVFEKTEYCSNCGNNIDKKIFEEKPLNKFAEFVEDSIKKVGIEPVLTRNGFDFWEFHYGSPIIRIFIFNNSYIYATSPINELPTTKLEELYKFILKDSVKPFRLAIYNNQIFLSYRMHISDINSEHSEIFKQDLINFIKKSGEMETFLSTNIKLRKQILLK